MVGLFVFVFQLSGLHNVNAFLSPMHGAHYPDGTQIHASDTFATKIVHSVSHGLLLLLFPSELQNVPPSHLVAGSICTI